MPAPNDLTPEEEEAFAQHGVQPAGPGREPVGDEPQQQPPSVEQPPAPEPPVQQEPPPPEAPQEPAPGEPGSRHRADGTFKNKDELAADAAAVAAQQPPPEQPRMVPHEALHAERVRAANAIRQAQLATTRMNALLAQRTEQQQPPQMPDLEQDPAGYIQRLEERLAQFEQGMNQQNEYRQVDSALEQDEQLFELSQPDYQQASDHYVRSRGQELVQLYPPDQARDYMIQEAREIAKQAWQRGQSPAQLIYNLAVARGYSAGQPGQQAPAPQGQQPPPQQQPGPSPQARVAAVNNGQAASRSLSGGGQGATQALNADALLSMSDDEFETYLALGKKGANDRFAAIG